MNLADIGRHWARWQPNEIAVRTPKASITWRQLDQRTSEFSVGLVALGIGHGDRIALLLTNRIEWIELTIAAWKLGAVIVPINVRFTATEVAVVTADAQCRLVFTENALQPATAAIAASATVINIDGVHALEFSDAVPSPTTLTAASDPAFLCYTSGTTGDPKGAVLTHGSWNVASQGWAQATQLTTSDRVVLPFPLAFTGGLAVFLFTYWAGARLVLEPTVDVDRLFDLFEIERITALFAVPLIHQQLVDHPRFATADLSSWRIASSGGAPVPTSLLRAVQARGVPMLQGFSLTEASAAATVLPAADALRKVGSAGLPVMHGTISVVDDHGTACAAGEIGEILVGGPQIMAAYWNNPTASAAALAGGMLHSGDLGYLDPDGYLFVVDRKKDMLISGGLNVYPAEIERVLAELEGVIEVAVIGVAHEKWGETPAVIAYTGGRPLDPRTVLQACAAQLADYKLPRYLQLVDEPLPRSMSGKILKRELRRRFADLASHTTPIR